MVASPFRVPGIFFDFVFLARWREKPAVQVPKQTAVRRPVDGEPGAGRPSFSDKTCMVGFGLVLRNDLIGRRAIHARSRTQKSRSMWNDTARLVFSPPPTARLLPGGKLKVDDAISTETPSTADPLVLPLSSPAGHWLPALGERFPRIPSSITRLGAECLAEF